MRRRQSGSRGVARFELRGGSRAGCSAAHARHRRRVLHEARAACRAAAVATATHRERRGAPGVVAARPRAGGARRGLGLPRLDPPLPPPQRPPRWQAVAIPVYQSLADDTDRAAGGRLRVARARTTPSAPPRLASTGGELVERHAARPLAARGRAHRARAASNHRRVALAIPGPGRSVALAGTSAGAPTGLLRGSLRAHRR